MCKQLIYDSAFYFKTLTQLMNSFVPSSPEIPASGAEYDCLVKGRQGFLTKIQAEKTGKCNPGSEILSCEQPYYTYCAWLSDVFQGMVVPAV